jgi:hypothetical protein
MSVRRRPTIYSQKDQFLLIPAFFEMNTSKSHYEFRFHSAAGWLQRRKKSWDTRRALSRSPSANVRVIGAAFCVMEAGLEESNYEAGPLPLSAAGGSAEATQPGNRAAATRDNGLLTLSIHGSPSRGGR